MDPAEYVPCIIPLHCTRPDVRPVEKTRLRVATECGTIAGFFQGTPHVRQRMSQLRSDFDTTCAVPPK
jgi:hypothetical protein